MRTRWKILSGTGVVGLGIVVLLLGYSRHVSGDTATADPSADPIPSDDDQIRDPLSSYPTPGAITYDELSPADKTSVDHIQEVVETSQPPASYEAFAKATGWTSRDVDRKLAERTVGLIDMANDGVVP